MNSTELIKKIIELNTKFVIVTGGVCSSLGKGVLISSLGVLLKSSGYSVSVVKWDPYLNVDPGTMSPLVHGEVFVTQDGAETDLDLGHYERMIGTPLTKDSSVSSGQIFEEILEGERSGRFLGKCIQLVPHVVDVAKQRLLKFAINHTPDFVLLEIGGTVGDIEGDVFLEAIRQLRMDLGQEKIMHCHLSYVPFLEWTGEVKTKPTQHSIMQLKKSGLVPDALFLRSDKSIDQHTIDKLGIMCGIKREFIFQVLTYNPIYNLFISLYDQGVAQVIQNYFGIREPRNPNLIEWKNLITLLNQNTETITIGLIAKYVGSNDPYISVIEAIRSAAAHCHRKVKIEIIDAEQLEADDATSNSPAWVQLKSFDGIVVPGGFDKRGVKGKVRAAKWARENNIPYFGLCLGMQIMLIEAAQSLLGYTDANSTEFDTTTMHPVVTFLPEQRDIRRKGGSMRLGSSICTLKPNTKAYAAYKASTVSERHRHRYEVNNIYKNEFENIGIVFSGIFEECNLVEISEYSNHPFMLGTQYHPEFQSSPLKAHPLFKAFIEAVIEKNKTKI
ncbi:MAG: CTP synthase [Candidatus Dependentiae bacterium]|nr:CTP synthase [Candidatus Dependentiae bacterium]